MISFLLALVFMSLAMMALVLRKAYYYLPQRELKRQAKSGEPLAATLYRVVAYGDSLQLLLWLWAGIMAALGFVLLARSVAPLVGVVLVAAALWFAFAWVPSQRLTRAGARLAVWFTPAVAWMLAYAQPVFQRATNFVQRHYPAVAHTGLYQREDMIELIKRQRQQLDNRMSEGELELIARALRFGEQKVRDIVIPRKQVQVVAATEPVGPILIDELHKVGHLRIPVYGDSPNEIIGTLYLRDLVDAKSSGKVSDFMEHRVYYVHESDTLADVLHAYYKTKHHLFVAVNSFEEYVGIVTLDDVLRALAGERPADDFEGQEDRHMVASRHERPAKKPSAAKPKAESAAKE